MIRPVTLMLMLTLSIGLPARADAPVPDLETVLVPASSLDGIWKIAAPKYHRLSLLHGFQGPLQKMQNILCRIQDRVVRCMGPALMVEGSVSVTGTHAHFAWGTAMARPVIEAMFESPIQFTGEFSFKLSGIAYTAPDPASGTKLNLAALTPSTDQDGILLTRILAEMKDGASSLAPQGKDVALLPPDMLVSLGAVQSVFYLGESGELVSRQDPKLPTPAQYKIPTDYKVYDVEFANGERLCGLRHGLDGQINGFRCV